MSSYYHTLTTEEIEEMFDNNAFVLIENVLKGLAEHWSTSLFEPHPYNKMFNLKVQDLIKKYRNRIEL